MVTENLSTLKIHKLTQEQYERERDAGRLDETALYLTPDQCSNADDITTFDTFPTVEQINNIPSSVSYFKTKGFHSLNDGLGCVYKISHSALNSPYISHGNKYFCPAILQDNNNNRDIFVDYYGVRRYYGAEYMEKNSEIMNKIISTLPNGFTLLFGSGHYFFKDPITCPNHTIIRGPATNASVEVEAVNYGAYLHFTQLTEGQAAISLKGGVVQDIGIMGNSSTNNISINRDVFAISDDATPNREAIVTEVNNATTYGINIIGGWGFTIQNVRVRYFTYGMYTPTCNGLITHVDAHNCKIGISVGNDIKINNVQLWNVLTGIQLRGPLASVVNVRGDSIGRHMVECWRGKCMLSNIDGDFCVGSLIHYGDGQERFMDIGQADLCMGRVATKYAYRRQEIFDLNNVPASDYEYCSYISIAPNTYVFGGHIAITNVSANVRDVASAFVHPNTPISIGEGSTVKGLTVKCNVPYDADLAYFNRCVIKNLSNYSQDENDDRSYVTNFDGNVIEDIMFITPIGFIRSLRTKTNKDRVLELSKDTTGAIRYNEQDLNDQEKLQARKNIGLDNLTTLEFVSSEDLCTNVEKIYVLPDGRTLAGSTEIIKYYDNIIPSARNIDGSIYNADETPGYRLAYFSGEEEFVPEITTWFVTGYIRANVGDILRFKNMEVMDMSATTSTKMLIKMYREDFSLIYTSGYWQPNKLPGSGWESDASETQNITRLKIHSQYAETYWVRLCVKYMDETSVISVNQEIKDPDIINHFGDTGLRFITDETYTKLMALLGET